MSKQQTGSYTVVARRYRPQAFADLVGQPHVITALSNAIEQHRVGHAYLFTGARGVGKTSTARIFAKCLNCVEGPTTKPCNECDVCNAVSVGEDVDVLEIDGASNRGIDEIRQLRSNVNVRPSRCRYKIYIIDEVHMLTTPAFNALLKTLEEPPEHVKFIFCTTDPHKIPITVLSRCQRFDFSPVEADEITNCLRDIAKKEGVEAEEQALALIARRANGSMRDSQSLLEQILSFCDKKIEVADVYKLLGTADVGRVARIVSAMVVRDMPGAIAEIDAALKTGVDVGQLAQQVVGYLRDMMAAKVGCDSRLLLMVAGSEVAPLMELTQQIGLETILSMLQVIDQSVTRMQHSHHSRVLLEAAVLRCCELENLQNIADLLAGANLGEATSGAVKKVLPPAPPSVAISPSSTATSNDAKKKADVTPPSEPKTVASSMPSPKAESVDANPTGRNAQAASDVSQPQAQAVAPSPTPTAPVSVSVSAPPSTEEPAGDIPATSDPSLEQMWRRTLEEVGGMTADFAAEFLSVSLINPNSIKVVLRESYSVQMCNRPERRQQFEAVFGKLLNRQVSIQFESSSLRTDAEQSMPAPSRREKIRQLEKHPFVKSATQTFTAEVTDFAEPKTYKAK